MYGTELQAVTCSHLRCDVRGQKRRNRQHLCVAKGCVKNSFASGKGYFLTMMTRIKTEPRDYFRLVRYGRFPFSSSIDSNSFPCNVCFAT